MQLEQELGQRKDVRTSAGKMQDELTLHLEDGRIRSDYQKESTLHMDASKVQLEQELKQHTVDRAEAGETVAFAEDVRNVPTKQVGSVGEKAGKGVGMCGRGAAARSTPCGGMHTLKLQLEQFEQHKVDRTEFGEMHTSKMQEQELEQRTVDRVHAGEMHKESTLHLGDGMILSDDNIKEESTFHVEDGRIQLEYKIQKESTLHLGSRTVYECYVCGKEATTAKVDFGKDHGMQTFKVQLENVLEHHKVDRTKAGEMCHWCGKAEFYEVMVQVCRKAERAIYTRKQFKRLRSDIRGLSKEWQQAMLQPECPWSASMREEMHAAIAEVELLLG